MAFEFNFKGDFASRRDLHRRRVRAAFNFKIKGSFAAGFAGFSELLLGAPRSNQETLPGDAAGPSARFPAFLAANGRSRQAPNARRRPICLDGAEKRRAGRKKTRRMSERPKGASSASPARTEHRRGPGAACRAPSRHERFWLLLSPQK